MNILQLRYFAALAQIQNISKAAELLLISQSALSKNLMKLEAELGAPLFDRHGKKLSLNTRGEHFLECTKRILRDLDSSLDELSLLGGSLGSRIRICLCTECGELFDCIAGFKRLYPKAEFSVSAGLFEAAEIPDINDCDVLVYPNDPRFGKYSGVPFFVERYCLIVPSSHPLAEREGIGAQELSGLDLVFLRSEEGNFEFPYTVCSSLGIVLGSQCFTNSRATQRKMLDCGIALGILTESGFADMHAEGLHAVPILDPRFKRQIMLCFRREKRLSESALAFKSYLLDHFALPSE